MAAMRLRKCGRLLVSKGNRKPNEIRDLWGGNVPSKKGIRELIEKIGCFLGMFLGAGIPLIIFVTLTDAGDQGVGLILMIVSMIVIPVGSWTVAKKIGEVMFPDSPDQ